MNNRATIEQANRRVEWSDSYVVSTPVFLSTAEAAQRLGMLPRTLQKRLAVDAKKPEDKRRYPGAYRCQCGHGWFVPEGDLKHD